MNITPARAGLTPQIWSDKFFSEYVRKNRFARYMGMKTTDMIQIRRDLTTKSGDSITFAAVRRLIGAGVTGNTILEGNEEILDARSMRLFVYPLRHAVAVSNWDTQRSVIDLLNAAKDALMIWAMEKLRSDIVIALSAIDGVPYAASTAGQRNTWLADNFDRVQFGVSVANNAGNVMATSLANVDNTNDKMTGATLSLAKRRAQTASPHIRPISTDDENDEEWFVVFMPSLVFRDFRNDPAVMAANANARPREEGWMDNPIFSGGDLVWDGMFVREIPELPVLTGAGTAGIDVAATFICGAQAIGIAWAQTTEAITNERDYKWMHGVGVAEIRGIGKLRFGRDAAVDTTASVDQGVYTLFTSAVMDA